MAMQADYLVKGCGATAMAFVDTMLRETDATFIMVDMGAAPGGHWNDAYPFVRLHQPSSFYGVASRQLGYDRKDETGFNKGLRELASGVEVADYFHQVMRDTFLSTDRVRYFPVCKVVDEDPGGGRAAFVSMLSGAREEVSVRKKLVDGTALGTSIPLTHQRNFRVAEGVVCIPPNDLTRLAPQHSRFTILGGGKTAIDSLLWLLANGAEPSAIAWVLPRDPWMINRASQQPGLEFFEQSVGGIANQYEIAATARSVEEFCEGMEAAGLWLRLDPAIWPTMMHAANVTVLELEQLRRIGTFIRMGRVKEIAADKILLGEGDTPAEPRTLYVDCTASALGRNVGDRSPVFSPGLVRLQMIRAFQPTFSAALIGYIEAAVPEDSDKIRLTRVTPMTDTAADFVRTLAVGISNQGAWNAHLSIRAWLRNCRLDAFARTLAEVDASDPVKRAVMDRIAASARPAMGNLRILSEGMERARSLPAKR